MEQKLNDMIECMTKSLNTLSDAFKPYQNINKQLISSVNIITDNINKALEPIYSNYYKDLTSNFVQIYSDCYSKLKLSTDLIYDNYSKMIQRIVEISKKEYINVEQLYDVLADMFWCFPFGMEQDDVLKAIQQCSTEEELDLYLQEYYDEEKINEMVNYVSNKLDGALLNMFQESTYAFNGEKYSISNLGFLYVFEGCATFFMKDKSQTDKKEMFAQIYALASNDKEKYSNDLINLKIMNKHVQILYTTHYENDVEIIKNRKAQRNLDMHGRGVVKNRIDNIRLINSICELLRLIYVFSEYQDTIVIERKKYKKTRKAELAC